MDHLHIVFSSLSYDVDKIGHFTYGKIYEISLVKATNSTIGLYICPIVDDKSETHIFYLAHSLDIKSEQLNDWKEYDLWKYFDTIEEWRASQLDSLIDVSV